MTGPVHDIAFDGTTYVRVSLAGLIQTSTNGIDWTNQTSGVSTDLWGASYGNGFFIVTGVDGVILRSPDGAVWTAQASTTIEDIFAVTFSDIFVAVGTNGLILFSGPFGDYWGGIDSGTSEDLWDVSHSGGLYEAVGDNDTIIVGEITTDNLSVSVFDSVDLVQGLNNNGVFGATTSDGIYTGNHRAFHDEEDLQFWDSVSDNMLVQGAVSEIGTFNHIVAETINVFKRLFINNESLVDGFSIDDVIFGGFKFILSENIELDDTAANTYNPLGEVIEAITIDDTAAGSLTIGIPIIDTIGATDLALPTALLAAALQDGVLFDAVLETGVDGDADSQLWTTWVVNTRNAAVSEYVRYDFHSFAEYQRVYYGAKDTGIYVLEGAWDDGWLIKALIKTGLIDFGNEFQKKIPRMYLGLRNDGTMVLKTITNEGIERWYNLRKNQTGLGKGRTKSHGGVKSAYWQFELANITGDNFELNSIELMPIVLSRRVK